jgi:signal transduction histidine kinase
VSAANLDGPWNEARRAVELTLHPHFYQTRWFLPLVAASLALAAWVALRLRVLQVKARLNAVLAERSRIARELHDTLIQGFSGVTMQMQALAARLHQAPERGTLDEIIRDAGHCLREARLSVGGLRSAPGNSTGLADAIGRAARQLTETRDVRLQLNLEESPRPLPDDVEYNLLRITQEAITNAVKHSAARTIAVALEYRPQRLVLSVHDDGIGFIVPGREHSTPGHYGLIGMRERASQIHADLQLASQPGQGTTVRLDLPLPSSNGAPPATEPVMVDNSKVQ